MDAIVAWLLVTVAKGSTAVPNPPSLSLSIFGPGSAATDPTLGTVVQLKVTCSSTTPATANGEQAASEAASEAAAGCPPWVRIDRTDGVSDTTPFVRPIDEGSTFTWAPRFPYYFKPAWGLDTFPFGGSVDNAPISIVASGWSAQYNGTMMTQNSSAVVIYFTTSFEKSTTTMRVHDLGPGSVRLTVANDYPLPPPSAFGTVRFDRYFQNLTAPTTGPAQFKRQFFFNEHSGTGTIVVTLQEPGVYYYGVTPTYQGRAGGISAGGSGDDSVPSTHPTALVVAGPDGAPGINQSIPPNFQGIVHHTVPLRTRHQFCIFERNITIFSGAQVRLPLCRPDKAEQPPQPGFISIIAPSWLTVQTKTNKTCASCKASKSALNSTGDLGSGRTRSTFAALGNMQKPLDPKKKPNPNRMPVDGFLTASWSTYNNFAPFYFSWDPDRKQSTVEISVLIHYTPTEGSTVPVAQWQTLAVRCVVTPRLPTLPKRLVTSLTWADIGDDLMLDDGSPFWLSTYKRMGFNTVPQVGVMSAFMRWTKDNTTLVPNPTPGDAKPYTFPSSRTGPEWDGLLYGPQISNPSPSSGPSACSKAPNATLLPNYLTKAQVAVEMKKWANAFAFHTKTKNLDIGYDGVWSQRATLEFCAVMNATQPDWIYIDDEAFGEGWGTWWTQAALSDNAMARAVPGETTLNLAWRMAAEMMASFTQCLASVSPKTNVHWYGYGVDAPFPDGIFAQASISMGPSVYGQAHYLQSFADGLRSIKQHQSPMPGGKLRHLLPWETACTYGQMTAVQAWEETLHAFGSGATGFAYFGVFFHGCFDDPAKLLALSTAVAIAVAYEDHFLDGTPLSKGAVVATAGGLRAWSGVRLKGSHWLVLTPGDQHGNTLPSTLTVTVALEAKTSAAPAFTACDLISGKIVHGVTANATAITVTGLWLTRTTVLLIAPAAACVKLPADVWLPQPGFNY